jgi:thymidylate kinase
MIRKIRNGRLIVFLGPVGVGKSTIISRLVQELKTRKIKVFTIFIKAFHGSSYILWTFVARILGFKNITKKHYAPWFSIPRSGCINLARVLIIISLYFDTFLSIPLKLMLIKLLKYAGYFVLSEEYIHSTLLEYIYSFIDLKMEGMLRKLILVPMKLLSVLLNRYPPDVTVILLADISELRHRWFIRGHGEPQLRYVISQQIFFNILKKLNNVFILDATQMSLNEVLNKILHEVI